MSRGSFFATLPRFYPVGLCLPEPVSTKKTLSAIAAGVGMTGPRINSSWATRGISAGGAPGGHCPAGPSTLVGEARRCFCIPPLHTHHGLSPRQLCGFLRLRLAPCALPCHRGHCPARPTCTWDRVEAAGPVFRVSDPHSPTLPQGASSPATRTATLSTRPTTRLGDSATPPY